MRREHFEHPKILLRSPFNPTPTILGEPGADRGGGRNLNGRKKNGRKKSSTSAKILFSPV